MKGVLHNNEQLNRLHSHTHVRVTMQFQCARRNCGWGCSISISLYSPLHKYIRIRIYIYIYMNYIHIARQIDFILMVLGKGGSWHVRAVYSRTHEHTRPRILTRQYVRIGAALLHGESDSWELIKSSVMSISSNSSPKRLVGGQ